MKSLDVVTHWREIRRVFAAAFSTSLHYAIASVDADGAPHVTPIGSVMLTETGRALYFEIYTRQLPANLRKDQRVALLAVHSGRLFWLRALLTGRFPSPPAVRLKGRVSGEPRRPTEQEVARFRRRIRRIRYLPGYRVLWGSLVEGRVHEIEIERAEPVHLGPATRGHWEAH